MRLQKKANNVEDIFPLDNQKVRKLMSSKPVNFYKLVISVS